MTLKEAIAARHSVRAYQDKRIEAAAAEQLKAKIDECNQLGHLHIQLVENEPRAFQGRLAKYGKFSGVSNYLMMIGRKDASLDERVGYYGEQIVLLAQTLGLNTCWVGLTYSKTSGAYELADGERVVCCIAIGYGLTQGVAHKVKTAAQVSNVSEATPQWFLDGVEAALLAPTAINQQKFRFEHIAPKADEKPRVKAIRAFSLAGYTRIDLGIAKCHFEIGAGDCAFQWA